MPTLKYLDPITGTYKAIAGLYPGPPPVVPPPSGTWGVGELGKYSSQDNTTGREIYLDSAGKLRAKPDVINYGGGVRPPTDLPGTYPIGTSVMTIATAGGAAWPAGASCVVVTHKRVDADAAGQWCYLNSGTQSKSWYRNGTTAAWGPWEQIAGTNDGVWVDCTAETRWCTDVSTAANAGQTSTSRYCKVGKLVYLWVAGTVGSAAVPNFAFLLPPSAGVPNTATTQYGNPPGLVGTGGTNVNGGWRLLNGDRMIFYESSGAFSDSGAGWSIRGNFTYEVV